MNIYLVSQDINNGYDTYDSFVCYAESEDKARLLCPSKFNKFKKDGTLWFEYSSGEERQEYKSYDWVSNPNDVKVEYLGTTTACINCEEGVILASFNAG